MYAGPQTNLAEQKFTVSTREVSSTKLLSCKWKISDERDKESQFGDDRPKDCS